MGMSSINNRVETILKKTKELSILCKTETCVVYYAPNGHLQTWPDPDKAKDIAVRFQTATKRKQSLTLHEFLEEEKSKKKKTNKTKLEKYPTWYPVFDHYTPDQLSELLLILRSNLSSLEEKIQRKSIQAMATNPLNPNAQFSLYMYDHGDGSVSQLPSHFLYALNHNFTNTPFQQQSPVNNYLMQQHGLDHNMSNNFQQHPCLPNNTFSHVASSSNGFR